MKKINTRITLNIFSLILLSLVLIVASIQLISIFSIQSNMLNINNLWHEVNIEQTQKRQLSYALQRFLGFNGMIHKLNNSLNNKDNKQIISAKNDIQSIKLIILRYQSLPLTPAERYALNDINEVVTKYHSSSDNLLTLFAQNAPPSLLLQQLKIDNTPALQGVAVLEQYNRHEDINETHSNAPTPLDKQLLLTDIVKHLGFDGLANNSKHDATNSTINQYNISQLSHIITQYQSVAINKDELHALRTLQQGINEYVQKWQYQPLSMPTLTTSIEQISQALQWLNEHIQLQQHNKIYQFSHQIVALEHNIERVINTIFIFSLTLLLLFSYIVFSKVILPLQSIKTEMVHIARQHYQPSRQLGNHLIDEINTMARAMRIFKHNESKRRHTTKSLTRLNQSTQQRLNAVNEQQDRSEQKTEQALTLANHLIKLQQTADNERSTALDSQRRINTILNTVHDAIITTDHQGIIETVNTITEFMLGYHEHELIGKSIMHIMPEDMVAMHHKIMKNIQSDNPPELPKRCHEQFIKRADNTLLPAEVFMGQSKFNGDVNYTVVIRDITRRKKDEEEIQKLILTDPLTNLANRRHFNQDLQRSMDNTLRLKLGVALLMIDLDNFKPVNDTYGHNAGDKVLQEVAKRLTDVTRSVDLIARLGGDEFAIILNSLSECVDPIPPAQKVIDSLKQPMHIDGYIITIGATVGIALSNSELTDKEQFMNQADKALYKAKALGKGQYFLYDDLDEDEK